MLMKNPGIEGIRISEGCGSGLGRYSTEGVSVKRNRGKVIVHGKVVR